MSDDLHTRAVHLPTPAVTEVRPATGAVYHTPAFEFDTAEELTAVMAGRAPGYAYSRIDNPSSDTLAEAIAALEGAQSGQPFASGMAAISTTMLTFLKAGDHVVAQRWLHCGTHRLLTDWLHRWGIKVSLVDDAAEAAAATTSATRLVWCEAIAGPALRVADIPAYAAAAHGAGALLAVDSTLATPVLCRPLKWGADLVVHSATKYIGGHSDATAGVVVGGDDLMARIRRLRKDLGGSLAPDEAFLMLRGLQTLPLRVQRQNATAAALAGSLREHPAMASVTYPGFADHPDHRLAKGLFRGGHFGAVVTVAPHGGREAAQRLCDSLRLCRIGPSLGGVVTEVSPVASMNHPRSGDEALIADGIDPAVIRIGVGLESPDDLLADFDRALYTL